MMSPIHAPLTGAPVVLHCMATPTENLVIPHPKIAFIQPFGFSSPGGGSKILRALVKDAPMGAISIVTSPTCPPKTAILPEVHLPVRPYFGRPERTRIGPKLSSLGYFYAPSFRRRLSALAIEHRVTAFHLTAHSAECIDAAQVARDLNIPYYLSIHDDLAYTIRRQPLFQIAVRRLGPIWREAACRFVISPEMGEEYCTRYGSEPYGIVTDGAPTIASASHDIDSRRFYVYFMGLLHLSYHANLQCLITALSALRELRPELDINLRLRSGGSLPDAISVPPNLKVTLLPFTSEDEIAADLRLADLLYLPLPFGVAHRMFTQFSLSTKMVSYLASGIPILYHGPIESCAAGTLLKDHNAAVCVESLDSAELLYALNSDAARLRKVADAGLDLAADRFRLEDMRQRFWAAIYDPPIASESAHDSEFSSRYETPPAV